MRNVAANAPPLHQSLELSAIQNATAEGSLHKPLELVDVPPEQLGGLVVEGIVGVGFVEEVDEAVDDGVDVEDGLPVLPEDVKADLALEVDVGMVDTRFAVDLGRGVGVMVGDLEREEVGGALPESGVWGDGDFEGGEVVRVREVDLGNLSSVELGDIYICELGVGVSELRPGIHHCISGAEHGPEQKHVASRG